MDSREKSSKKQCDVAGEPSRGGGGGGALTVGESLENRKEGLQGRDTTQSEENGCGSDNHRDKPEHDH